MKKKITADEFNRMATAILLKFMEWDQTLPHQRQKKLMDFNEWLNKSAEQTELFKNEKQTNNE